MPRPALAKLSRPRLFGVVRRERVLQLLEDRLAHPAVWIAAPPGAGKTTLAASYVDASKRPALWFQVDSDDTDPATFFHYLGVAAEAFASGDDAAALPALTPEYLPDLPGFTRRYVRMWLARLPAGALLVFDNYQEMPANALTHVVAATLLEELPAGIGCVVISRQAPPPAFARQLAAKALATITWDDLRLTEGEALAVAKIGAATDAASVRAAYRRADGWIAGLILILGQPGAAAAAPGVPPGTPETVFHYFAGTFFDRLQPDTRKMLLATAMLPRMTARLATTVSQVQRAGEALDELYRCNHFVDRRLEGEPTYQLHALFREFLLDSRRREHSADEQREGARRAARALQAAGHVDEAAALYAEAGDWTSATALILEVAPGLLAQGRGMTVLAQLARIPDAVIDAQPWLRFWQGLSQSATDIVQGRAAFARAYEGFAQRQDALGQMLSAAAVVQSFSAAYDDAAPMRPWIGRLEALLATEPSFPDPESELQVASATVFAMMVTAPANPSLPALADRLLTLVERDLDPNLRAGGVVALLNYATWLGNFEFARRASAVGRGLCANPGLLPIRAVWVLVAQVYWWNAQVDERNWRESCDRAQSLMVEHGLSILQPFVPLCIVWGRIDFGEITEAAAAYRQAAAAIRHDRRGDVWLGRFVGGWLAFMQGDLDGAERETAAALAVNREIGWVHTSCFNLCALAVILVERGKYDAAAECVQQVRREYAAVDGPMIDFQVGLIDAYLALRQGDTEYCAASLAAALAIGRGHGYLQTLRWYPPMMTRLAAFALEHDVEPEYVCMLIRRRRMVPERPIEAWPWPVRVYTLGRFALVREDAPVVASGKAQHKPLDLLKALVAHGSRGAAVDALIGILWPEPPEDGGRRALEITVHRLRKILGSDDTVVVSGRRVALSDRHVWVDAWAVDAALTSLATPPVPSRDERCALEEAAGRLLALYGGPFLADERDVSWLLPLRNRIAGGFQRLALRLGELWEGARQWERAAELYARIVEIDPLAETFYRRQMICLEALDRRAEALEVFRRLRQTLSVLLGIAPSAETVTLHRRLLA